MLNNDVLRRVRYILDLSDEEMIKICDLGGLTVNRKIVSEWLKRDEDPAYISCKSVELASFLNGLIVDKRGARDGQKLEPEQELTNNIVLRKIVIAFSLKSEEVIDMLKLAEFHLGKGELSAFFRKPEHKNYRECKAQILRNFLKGLQIKHRDKDKSEKNI